MVDKSTIAALFLASTALSSTGVAAQQPREGVLTIGLASPVTGDFAANSDHAGAQCMAEIINERASAGDIRIEVVVEDSQSDHGKSVKMASTLLDRGIVVVSGNPWPDAIVPITELAMQRNAIVVSHSVGQPEMHQLDLVNFAAMPAPDDVMASGLGATAYGLGARTAVLLSTTQPDSWTQLTPVWFGEALERLGGKVVAKFDYDATDPQWKKQAVAVMAVSPVPDVVHVCTIGSEAGSFANELASLGYKGLLAGCDGFDDSALASTVKDPDVLGRIIFTSQALSLKDSPGGTFMESCKAKGHNVSTTWGVLGGEMVELLAMAAKDAGTTTDGPKIMQAIRSRPSFDLFTGAKVSFTGATYPRRPIPVVTFKNGEPSLVSHDFPTYIPVSK